MYLVSIVFFSSDPTIKFNSLQISLRKVRVFCINAFLHLNPYEQFIDNRKMFSRPEISFSRTSLVFDSSQSSSSHFFCLITLQLINQGRLRKKFKIDSGVNN